MNPKPKFPINEPKDFVCSPGHRKLLLRANRIGSHDEPVLIEGEMGTGKSTLAVYLHGASERSTGPLIRFGCGEIEHNLISSVLFGHAKGAYTGATQDQKGLLARADKGTLILDDIDVLPKRHQSSLLRFLDDGIFHRLGEPGKEYCSNARFVATTNKDLKLLVSQDLFLHDLYSRMACWRLITVPLRKRPEDIITLATHFLEKYCRVYRPDEPALTFSTEALNLLMQLKWPGNIRELDQKVKNIALFCDQEKGEISMKQSADVLFDPEYGDASMADSKPRWVNVYESTGRNVSLTARILGHSRTTIHKWLKEDCPN